VNLAENHRKASKKKILIVDDERDIGLSLKRVLEGQSFSVDYYSDSLEALSNFRAEVYDLAIFDIRMPRIDGTELYRRIRELDKRIKICFISAYEITIEELSRILPDYILNCLFKKPVRAKVLLEKVSEALAAT
jgi:two-component system response regulator ChvI